MIQVLQPHLKFRLIHEFTRIIYTSVFHFIISQHPAHTSKVQTPVQPFQPSTTEKARCHLLCEQDHIALYFKKPGNRLFHSGISTRSHLISMLLSPKRSSSPTCSVCSEAKKLLMRFSLKKKISISPVSLPFAEALFFRVSEIRLPELQEEDWNAQPENRYSCSSSPDS